MTKTLDNTNVEEAKTNIPDLKVVGNGDMWQLLCKASSQGEGWMKSTKAMQLPDGCLVQVTTQQRGTHGPDTVAEAITYVPGVRIVDDINGGKKLVGNDIASCLCGSGLCDGHGGAK